MSLTAVDGSREGREPNVLGALRLGVVRRRALGREAPTEERRDSRHGEDHDDDPGADRPPRMAGARSSDGPGGERHAPASPASQAPSACPWTVRAACARASSARVCGGPGGRRLDGEARDRRGSRACDTSCRSSRRPGRLLARPPEAGCAGNAVGTTCAVRESERCAALGTAVSLYDCCRTSQSRLHRRTSRRRRSRSGVEDAFLDGDTDGDRDQLSLSQTAIASPSLRLSALRR